MSGAAHAGARQPSSDRCASRTRRGAAKRGGKLPRVGQAAEQKSEGHVSGRAEPALRRVQFPKAQCPKCSGKLFPYMQEATEATVLDAGGWVKMLHVPVRCRRNKYCAWHGQRVWHNFAALSKGQHEWAWPHDEEMHVFFMWQGWGVTTAWLRQMSRRLVHHFASFCGEAAVHAGEASYLDDITPPPARADLKLMRAWVVWRALLRMEERAEALGQPCSLNLIQNSEAMLGDMWCWYPDFMLQKRVSLCRQAGEDLSKVVVDGNQKLCRRVCGRPVAELTECKPLGLFTATPCSCTPAFKQRRCQKHSLASAPQDRGPEQSEVIVQHRRQRVLRAAADGEPYQVLLKLEEDCDNPNAPGRWVAAEHVTAGQLYDYWSKQEATGYVATKSPPNDLASTICSTHKESVKGYKKLVRQGRLCGWLIATTSNGMIVHAKEFVGAESIPQRYFFVAELVDQASEVSVLVHDDACHLRRFAAKRSGHSELAARLAYPSIRYVVDKMHAKGHVDPWCKANCHPDVPQNADAVRGVCTPRCEIVNSVIGRHKFALRHMRRRTAAFFVHEVIHLRNAETFKQSKKRLRAQSVAEACKKSRKSLQAQSDAA